MHHTVLPRDERVRRFGIDVGEKLHFSGWRPGGEYRQKIIVKNVFKQMQTVSYRLPETKFFSMKFPEPLKLGAGVQVALELVFRPLLLEPYEDFIEFSTSEGSFLLPVHATVPVTAFHFPPSRRWILCGSGNHFSDISSHKYW